MYNWMLFLEQASMPFILTFHEYRRAGNTNSTVTAG